VVFVQCKRPLLNERVTRPDVVEDASLAAELPVFRRFAGPSSTFVLRDRVRVVAVPSVSPLSISGTVASEVRCVAALLVRLRMEEATLASMDETDTPSCSASCSGKEIACPSWFEPKLSRFSECASESAVPLEERVTDFLVMDFEPPDFFVEAFEAVSDSAKAFDALSVNFVEAFLEVLDFFVEAFKAVSSTEPRVCLDPRLRFDASEVSSFSFFARLCRVERRVETGESWERVLRAGESSS
jgi:hypothetical protein